MQVDNFYLNKSQEAGFDGALYSMTSNLARGVAASIETFEFGPQKLRKRRRDDSLQEAIPNIAVGGQTNEIGNNNLASFEIDCALSKLRFLAANFDVPRFGSEGSDPKNDQGIVSAIQYRQKDIIMSADATRPARQKAVE
jgi:hypothetical protein